MEGVETESISRLLNLGKDVTSDNVIGIITDIYKINLDDTLKSKKFKKFKRLPIQLLINTMGGSVYDGFALINAILQSKTKIHTICVGNAMSMGLPILLCGSKRFVYRYSTLMYHEVSNFMCDKLTGIKQTMEEGERLQTLLDNIILKYSNVKKEQLDIIKSLKKDWFITPEEALSLKLIDELI